MGAGVGLTQLGGVRLGCESCRAGKRSRCLSPALCGGEAHNVCFCAGWGAGCGGWVCMRGRLWRGAGLAGSEASQEPPPVLECGSPAPGGLLFLYFHCGLSHPRYLTSRFPLNTLTPALVSLGQQLPGSHGLGVVMGQRRGELSDGRDNVRLETWSLYHNPELQQRPTGHPS